MRRTFQVLILLTTATAICAQQSRRIYRVPVSAKVQVHPFRLDQVQLLDGPFRRAMELDAGVLLKLEPDRLLHNFRENAGLQPKGQVYGGWESQGVAGHSLGHYLSALAIQPLTFRTVGVGRPDDVTLVPLFRSQHQRFTVYWDGLTTAEVQ